MAQHSAVSIMDEPATDAPSISVSPPVVATFVPSAEVQQLIARGREKLATRPPLSPVTGTALASGLSGFLLWASFEPLNWSPLAWIALVPVLCLVRAERYGWRHYALVANFAAFSQIAQLQWMRLGDPTMYLAWLALACYLACYLPAFLLGCRIATKTWNLPLVVTAPVLWVGIEYLKAHLLTGFAWYLLGHSQYRWLELIQISDVVGAYGVSFLVAMSSAVLAGYIPESWLRICRITGYATDSSVEKIPSGPASMEAATKNRKPIWPAAMLAATFVMVLGYGVLRRGQADFKPGPRVALIQGNFTASLHVDPEEFGPQYLMHQRLTGLAVREQPDVVIWPEGMFRWPLLSIPPGITDEQLEKLTPMIPPDKWRDTTVRSALLHDSQKAGAATIVGATTWAATEQGLKQFNSAAFVRPDVGLQGRYDKIHLVPFGEYLPLKETLPWLQSFTPYPPEFGLTAGQRAEVFEYRGYRMLPVICFEDTVPHLVRELVAAQSTSDVKSSTNKKPVDLLVNLSNDGWFHGSTGLDQHLITAAFRAVECRTPLVRAVNTGISAFIDGDGAIREPEAFLDGDRKGRDKMIDPKTGRWHRQLNAALVSTVWLDNRESIYVRYGDWFAMLCCAATVFAWLSGLLPRRA